MSRRGATWTLMNCHTAREQMDDGKAGQALAAHLSRCTACRAEAELNRRVALAIATLPRVSAPQALASGVMAGLRSLAPAEPTVRPLPLLRLRAWEVGWLGALFLALVVGGSLLRGSAVLPGWDSVTDILQQAGRWPRETFQGWKPVAMDWVSRDGMMAGLLHTAAASRLTASGMTSLLAFCISLLWLLTRYDGFRPGQEWEDAHA